MSRIHVILPSYNEQACILKVLEDWKSQSEKLSKAGITAANIIVVDDGSKDGTVGFVRLYQKKNPTVKLLQHAVNSGLGAAVTTGIQYVLSNSRPDDFICIMDSDNTHGAKYVLDMLASFRETKADVVIASRYQSGSEIHGLSQFRESLSNYAGWYYKLMMNVPGVRDYTCGYRLYSCDILKKLNDTHGKNAITQTGFTCMVEILYKIHRIGGRFSEVPFALRYDLKEGQSKMKIVRTCVKSLFLPLQLVFFLNRRKVNHYAPEVLCHTDTGI